MRSFLRLPSEHYSFVVLLVILILGIFLRFYRLDEIPGDTFGDMVENMTHIETIKNGDFKLIYGFDGREASYFYIATLSSFLFGNTYLNLKIVTSIVGLITIVTTYFLAEYLTNKKTALITAFLLAVSKWPLVYSRIGFRTVFTPLVTSIVFLFFFKSIKTKKLRDMVICAVFLGLGLYTYTAFKFVVVSVLVMSFCILLKNGLPTLKTAKNIVISSMLFGLITFPQVFDIWRAPDLYFSHPGPMILVDGKLPSDWKKKLLKNIYLQFGMLHIQGDGVNRINPPNQPQLDVISGVFFVFGLIGILVFYRNTNFLLLILSYGILQLPAILVLNLFGSVPSATRTTSIIPIVFLIVAIGIEVTSRLMYTQYFAREYSVVIVLSLICYLNYVAYFYTYPQTLPNRNVAFDKVIASYVNPLPSDTIVYLVGGAWGQEGQPHPRGIQYALEAEHQLKMINENIQKDVCPLLDIPPNKDFFIIINPELTELPKESCFVGKYQKMIMSSYGDHVFMAISSLPIQ